MMGNTLKKTILEHGQYRDVQYINKDGTSEGKRCLVVPAKVVEPLLKKGK